MLHQLILPILRISCSDFIKGANNKKYALIGADEFWIVEPNGKSLEIYYLTDKEYELHASYILDDDPENTEYDADTLITLRRFPNISMTLGDIFYDLDR